MKSPIHTPSLSPYAASNCKHAHSFTHSLAHTLLSHTATLPSFHTLTLSHTPTHFILSYSPSLTLPNSHTLTLPHSHSPTHSHTLQTLILSLSHTLTLPYPCTPHSYTLTLPYSHTLPLSHTLNNPAPASFPVDLLIGTLTQEQRVHVGYRKPGT